MDHRPVHDPDETGPENPLGIPNDEALHDLLRYFVTQDAPRVFALCELAAGWRKATVRAWGLAFPTGAVLYLPDDRSLGCFESAEHAHKTYSQLGDIRLIWPDYVPMREMLNTKPFNLG